MHSGVGWHIVSLYAHTFFIGTTIERQVDDENPILTPIRFRFPMTLRCRKTIGEAVIARHKFHKQQQHQSTDAAEEYNSNKFPPVQKLFSLSACDRIELILLSRGDADDRQIKSPARYINRFTENRRRR